MINKRNTNERNTNEHYYYIYQLCCLYTVKLLIRFSIFIILGMLEKWAVKYIMLHSDFFVYNKLNILSYKFCL